MAIFMVIRVWRCQVSVVPCQKPLAKRHVFAEFYAIYRFPHKPNGRFPAKEDVTLQCSADMLGKMITAHADVVGSLLRPPELLAAQKRLATGAITAEQFKAVEDRAVDEAVALQESAGLEIVTDGEMRRRSFQSQMTAAVSGFGEFDLDAFLWGEWHDENSVQKTRRPRSLGAVAKLMRRRYLSADEFTYLKSKTTRIPKITIPSPGLWANFWSPKYSREAYPTLNLFLADIVQILHEEVAELVRRGAGYIQIDAPQYGLLLDPKTRVFYEKLGWSLDAWLSLGIELDNAVIKGFPGVTFGFHV
jgi:5-methyltetrahydropteroyltriglutamate--homocysteine methyltransferase